MQTAADTAYYAEMNNNFSLLFFHYIWFSVFLTMFYISYFFSLLTLYFPFTFLILLSFLLYIFAILFSFSSFLILLNFSFIFCLFLVFNYGSADVLFLFFALYYIMLSISV